jgi:hypothetical protein
MMDRTLPTGTFKRDLHSLAPDYIQAQIHLWIGRAEQDIRAAERDKIAGWLRGMDESTATTLANWLAAGMYFKGDNA